MQESNRIEFKAVLNDKFEKEVSAFLNNREGGVLYIGLNDNGCPIENANIDDTQLKVADRIKNNIMPSTLGLFDVVLEEIDGVSVVKVLISSGLEKPYYIKSQGMSTTGCYMRVGASTQPMPTAMIDDLYAKRIHATLRNTLSPRQDLSFAQLKIYYQERGLELNNQFLNSLELLTPDGKLNYIAYLLADENGVSIKVAKYAGTDKVDLIENEELGYCSLVKAANNVLNKFILENKTKTIITSGRRIDSNLVNPVALREAIVNAIVHNDFSREIPPVFEIFSDKIVLTSYGGLISGQSVDDFFSGSSMPRNRELMRVFKDVGLVEQLGSGMSRILKAYNRNIFNISEHFIKVVFQFNTNVVDFDADVVDYGANVVDFGVDVVDNVVDYGANVVDFDADVVDNIVDSNADVVDIIELFRQNPNMTAKVLGEKLSVGSRQAQRLIDKLKNENKLVRVGSNHGGYWKVLDKQDEF